MFKFILLDSDSWILNTHIQREGVLKIVQHCRLEKVHVKTMIFARDLHCGF